MTFQAPGAVSASAGDRPAAEFRLRVASLSDLGCVRDHQEDALGVFAPPDPATLAQKGQLLIVADGMGGHQAGEVASRIAVDEIARAYYADPSEDVAACLAQALQAANQAIYRQAQYSQAESGMGTTVVAAVIRGQSVQVASIGDSRVYLLRDRTVSQITDDHSWVAEQVRTGALTREQAAVHPQSNLLLRALGKGEAARPDFFSGELQAGDSLLLCSDGLIRHVGDGELLEIATAYPPEIAVRRLVDLANSRGGSDNISIIVALAEQSVVPPPPPVHRTIAESLGVPPRLFVPTIAGLVVLALIAVVLAVLLVNRSREPGQATGAAGEAAPQATSTLALSSAAGAATAVLTGAPATLATAVLPTSTLAPIQGAARGATGSFDLPAAAGLGIAGLGPDMRLATNSPEFSWRWDGDLPAQAEFEVRIWKSNGDEHPAAGRFRPARDGNVWSQEIDLRGVRAVQGKDGSYRWTVTIVTGPANTQVAAEAEPGAFILGSAAPAATAAIQGTAPPATPRPATGAPPTPNALEKFATKAAPPTLSLPKLP